MAHEEASGLVLGTVPVPLERISFHPLQRRCKKDHLRLLRESFTDNMFLRWAHPIELVLSEPVDEDWKQALSTERKLPPLPPGVELVCINGKHRVRAALQLLKESENDISYWPAVLYSSGWSLFSIFIYLFLISVDMLDKPWLETFMVERNVPRLTMHTCDSDIMLALDRLVQSDPSIDVYSLVTSHSHDASTTRCLHESCIWEPFLQVLRDPFFSCLRKDVYHHWPPRWRVFPVRSFTPLFSSV